VDEWDGSSSEEEEEEEMLEWSDRESVMSRGDSLQQHKYRNLHRH
jgi:hypothetical protein